MKEMLVFYNKYQQVKENMGYSPSARKPKLVVQSWKQLGYPVMIKKIRALNIEEISLAHDLTYVKGILNGKIKNGFANKSINAAKSFRWTTGSFTCAALHAFHQKQNTFSPTSGFHHACYNYSAGFCTFSGLSIAAIILHKYHKVKKVGILDLDSHPGDGTENTLNKTNSVNFVTHYSLGYDNVQKDNNEEWLNKLPNLIKKMFYDCGILFFQAGVDCHEDDPEVTSGYFTNEQIYRRDKIVYATCYKMNIPVVTNLGGGYQKPFQKVLDLHNLTAKAFQDTKQS